MRHPSSVSDFLKKLFAAALMLIACSQCGCNKNHSADNTEEDKEQRDERDDKDDQEEQKQKKKKQEDKSPPSVMLIGQHGVFKTYLFKFLDGEQRIFTSEQGKRVRWGYTHAQALEDCWNTESAATTTVQCSKGSFLLTDTPNISSKHFMSDATDPLYTRPYNAVVFMVDMEPLALTEEDEGKTLLKYLEQDLYVRAHHNKNAKNPFETLYQDYRDQFIILLVYRHKRMGKETDSYSRIKVDRENILSIVKKAGFNPDKVLFWGQSLSSMTPKTCNPDRETLASQIYDMVKDMPKSKIDFVHGKSGSS